ncbi:armadillo-type protein [Gorgonomyces haynaldii]|nr:armadillo-type protein [Gorgonomyces haynaldii]
MTVQVVDQGFSQEQIQHNLSKLEKTLLDTALPLGQRFRALFTLKSLNTPESIHIIGKGFEDKSALLKHELAYVLGQMRNPNALDTLSKVLGDMTQEPMVRHEAAEAIQAIGEPSSISLLEPYLNDPEQVVRETVILAIDGLKFRENPSEQDDNPYASVDPAPALKHKELSTEQLKSILMDTDETLFKRYRAMFALRNRNTEESVLALAHGFTDSSALFRHEIAYVFGQMQHPASVPSLVQVLTNGDEHAMVRHEAAEALGSIATPECFAVLDKYKQDDSRVVRESCEVGLDMYEYETSGDFQYAKPLEQ